MDFGALMENVHQRQVFITHKLFFLNCNLIIHNCHLEFINREHIHKYVSDIKYSIKIKQCIKNVLNIEKKGQTY